MVRTTVDLPPAVHRRASELAERRGESLSKTLAQLAEQGLSQLDEPVTVYIDERSGFPVMRFGRPITPDDVDAALDE